MSLRQKMQGTASKLINRMGDVVQMVRTTTVDGATDTDPPVTTDVPYDVDAVVTGAGKWADGETILRSDLRLVVSGAFDVYDVGEAVMVNGKRHIITMREDALATGVKSAVIYFVRR